MKYSYIVGGSFMYHADPVSLGNSGERYSRPQKGRRLRRPAGGTGFPSVPQDRSAPSAETSAI